MNVVFLLEKIIKIKKIKYHLINKDSVGLYND